MGGRARSGLAAPCAFGSAAALVPFLAVLWNLGIDPLRRSPQRLNDFFFDVQAHALLRGELAIPDGSLGIEGFVVDGRTYMYFPPFPALLRLPITALTDRFDGRLTAASMLLAWVVTAVALSALVVAVHRALVGDAVADRHQRFGAGLLCFSVLGGSSLLYLGARPWSYHEVYVWSTAFVVATAAAVVRLLTATTPTWRLPLVATALAGGAILTRMPGGLAMAALLVVSGAVLLRRRLRASGVASIVGGLVVLAVGCGVNWAKFGTLYTFPIEAHLWSQVSPARQAALAANDNRIDGLQFFPTNLAAYFRPDGLRFVPRLPFVTLPATPPAPVGDVVLDESFRTGSLPALMPALFVGTVLAPLLLMRRRLRRVVVALALPLGAAVAATAAVMSFGYVAPRYTAEFVPALAIGATVTIGVLLARTPATVDAAASAGRPEQTRTARQPRRDRRTWVLGVGAVLVVFGAWVNGATALSSARVTGGGAGLVDWLTVQDRLGAVTGAPLADDATSFESWPLPPEGGADRLAIVGDCAALYIGTGETLSPWTAVEVRPTIFTVRAVHPAGAPPAAGVTPAIGDVGLITFRLRTEHRLVVEVAPGDDPATEARRFRLRLDGPGATTSDWSTVSDGPIHVVVDGDTAVGRWRVRASAVGGPTVELGVELTEWDEQFRSLPRQPVVDVTPGAGNDVVVTNGPRPPLCARLAADLAGR